MAQGEWRRDVLYMSCIEAGCYRTAGLIRAHDTNINYIHASYRHHSTPDTTYVRGHPRAHACIPGRMPCITAGRRGRADKERPYRRCPVDLQITAQHDDSLSSASRRPPSVRLDKDRTMSSRPLVPAGPSPVFGGAVPLDGANSEFSQRANGHSRAATYGMIRPSDMTAAPHLWSVGWVWSAQGMRLGATEQLPIAIQLQRITTRDRDSEAWM